MYCFTFLGRFMSGVNRNVVGKSFFFLLVVMTFVGCSLLKSSVGRVFSSAQAFSSRHDEVKSLAHLLSKELKIPLDPSRDDIGLYAFVADWLGTPYQYGGSSRTGCDCSGFIYILLREVYGIHLPRSSSAALRALSRAVGRLDLKSGDLVFFYAKGERRRVVSHVGVYLKDDLFAHASTSRGVIISSLRSSYYKTQYLGAGRIQP